jgi:cytochrome c
MAPELARGPEEGDFRSALGERLAWLVCWALFSLLCFLTLPSPSSLAAELRGHGGPVRAIAVTADGATAVTGSFDTAVILWSLADGRARQVLRFHDGQVNAVAVLPDGRFASAGADGRIALWRPGEATPVVLEGHLGPVAALAVSPDGGWLASAAWDATVRLWPLAGGVPRVLSGHQGNVNSVAFLPDGTLVSAGYDATLRFWRADSDDASKVVTLPTPLNAVAVLSADRLAVGGADGRVRVIDRGGESLGEVEIGPTPVISLAVSPDGRRIAAAGLKGAIAIVDADMLTIERRLVGPGQPVWSLAFTPDGERLLSGGSDRVVRTWDPDTGEHIGAIASAGEDPLAAFAGDHGAEVFRACAACHSLTPGGEERAGPSLHGIFGRRIATLPGYRYSEALKGMDIVWTPETVAKLFELGPATYTPGTRMPEQTISSAADRAALVEFLEKATAAD